MRSLTSAYFLFHCILFCLQSEAQVINGGFEQWDTTYYPMAPKNWTNVFANSPCLPSLILAGRTEESHSGDWAVAMENNVCVDDMGNERIEPGKMYSGTTGKYFPDTWGQKIIEVPERLVFQYKFHAEGNDSAYASIVVFAYDSTTQTVYDSIAFGNGFIEQSTDEYKESSVNLTREKNSNFQLYAHIFFSSSKTLTDLRHPNTPPYVYATPGTKFWVDDVQLQGSISVINSFEQPIFNFTVTPNPSTGIYHLSGDLNPKNTQISVHSLSGKLLHSEKLKTNNTIDLSHLPQGIYFLELDVKGEILRKKIVKE